MCVYEEVLPGHDTATKFYAHVRKDRDAMLQDLINSPEVSCMPSCCFTLYMIDCQACVPSDMPHTLLDNVHYVQANGMYLESQPLYSGGRRVYTDFSSGKWLEETQVCQWSLVMAGFHQASGMQLCFSLTLHI